MNIARTVSIRGVLVVRIGTPPSVPCGVPIRTYASGGSRAMFPWDGLHESVLISSHGFMVDPMLETKSTSKAHAVKYFPEYLP